MRISQNRSDPDLYPGVAKRRYGTTAGNHGGDLVAEIGPHI